MMKSLAAKLLRFLFRNNLTTSIASNRLVQQGIKQLVKELDYTRGIGAGAGVGTSGERILAELLADLDGNKTVFDVGANEGKFTELINSNVNNTEIHLFEPQEKLCKQLITEYSKEDDKVINCFALSDKASQTTLYYDEEGSGLASMSKRKLDHYGIEFDDKETIETKTLDGYCDDMGVAEIDLLKLDVEGHEFDILEGVERMLSQQNIRFISFEFGGANIDTRTYFQDYFYLFKKYDYNIYRILPNSDPFPITQYDEVDEAFRTTNYLATRNEI